MAGLGDGGVLVGGGCEGRVGGSEGDPDDLDSALVLGLEAEGEVGVLGGGVVVSDCEDGEVGREVRVERKKIGWGFPGKEGVSLGQCVL